MSGSAPYRLSRGRLARHALPFDLIVNGSATCRSASSARSHSIRACAARRRSCLSTTLCAALSIHLEAMQTYLPSRVASKVDVLANGPGALVGALLAARFAHVLLDTGRLRVWRTRWFATDASRGLVLVVVWFGALVYPGGVRVRHRRPAEGVDPGLRRT